MNTLEDFLAFKGQAINILNEIQNIVYSNQITSPFCKIVSQSISNIESDKFIVGVVGIIKRGKSTLLNALLKAETDILSTQVTPETARLAVLNYADSPSAIINTIDSQQIKISLNELPYYTSSYDTVSPKGIKEKVEITEFAEILLPNEILKKGFTIVDTPGVDDPDERRSRVTLNFIDRADAVVFLMSASEGGLKDSELKFLQSKILNNQGTSKGIVCAMNKISDLKERQLKNELPKLIEKNEKLINKVFGTNIKIFPIDARDALNAYRNNNNDLLERSRFTDFYDHLIKYLVEEKGKIFLRIRINKFIKEDLNNQIIQLEKTISEKPKSILDVEKKLAESEAEQFKLNHKFNELLNKYSEEKKSLNTWIEKTVISKFNSTIFISPKTLPNLTADINCITQELSKTISIKSDSFINDLISNFDVDNITVTKPDFRFIPKNIETTKYFKITKIEQNKTDDGSKVGGIIGGVLGAFGGPWLIGVGAVLGSIIGDVFSSDALSEENIKFDEIGLKKEIDDIKIKLTQSFQSSLEHYFNEVLLSIKKIINQRKENIKLTYDSHKRVLESKTQDYDLFKEQIQDLINKLTIKKNDLNKLLMEIDQI